ncbi:hypothetical protein [Variovorax sp. RA8]|uniref:hypothetical protein n=1 Tax=Variovorax sp. (strain JCM 16519 / RA8) TaxID=662548 RepID=UPI0013191113|nr:hypothetical protein [Variovorax sp. RA8]VTU29722.1 hypothetical protein RA8CHR_04012 [Variovorax sp. RA8]
MIYFGDIHNHNAHGYGKGTIERSIDIAREHLDFFAFTGHSSWHDLTAIENGRERHFIDGFRRLKETWPRVQERIAQANAPGRFVSFLGFEWHSNMYGDQCVIFPRDHRPIKYTSSLQGLREFCLDERALMIPHHLGYPRGRRGVNWDVFDPACTPVVEIFSFHGLSEHDRGPHPMVRGSPGGRQTQNTVRAALNAGLRFGFVASTDNHAGFPGAWGEGLLAVHADALSREHVLDAVRSRCTYALTGDRIRLDCSLNGAPMGATVAPAREYRLQADIEAADEIDVVELVVDGEVLERFWPRKPAHNAALESGEPLLVRYEWGWGPWGELSLDRIADWQQQIGVHGGRLLRIDKCLGGGPYDEDRRHRIAQDGDCVDIRSYTSRRNAFADVATHAVVMQIQGDAATELTIETQRPARLSHRVRLQELLSGSANFHVGAYGTESFQFHRAVVPSDYRMAIDLAIPASALASYAYLRVQQLNGQLAWASPFFVAG